MTAGVYPLISLETIPSRPRIIFVAILIGSMPFSGVEPWQPFPRTVIAKSSLSINELIDTSFLEYTLIPKYTQDMEESIEDA